MTHRVGYTTGVFDLFHVGHLNILRNARAQCDRLIVGVTTDDLAETLKGRKPIIPYSERAEIVSNLSCVDSVCPEATPDKLEAWKELGFDIIFKGDDWRGTPKWNRLEEEFAKVGVEVVYFEYTRSTSSTMIRKILEEF